MEASCATGEKTGWSGTRIRIGLLRNTCCRPSGLRGSRVCAVDTTIEYRTVQVLWSSGRAGGGFGNCRLFAAQMM